MNERCLRVQKNQIVDANDREVLLRGPGLGGWMNMENFITGYPGNEQGMRRAVEAVLGGDLAGYLWDRFLEHFFTADDARLLASVGMSCVRLPLNYRHFEDDAQPFRIRPEGFRHLDRVVELCAAEGLYTILDLHTMPGGQNQDWHSDNPTHKALFWEHPHFQDRVVHLWEQIARRYRDNPMVAGYDLMNEPGDVSRRLVGPFYRRLAAAVRAIDPDHILFVEGNRYANDFDELGEPLPNSVFSNHDYAAPGFQDAGPYPGVTWGTHHDRDTVREAFKKRSEVMLRRGLPIWVGEFGPVYSGDPEKDAMRLRLLGDQLDNYRQYRASWAIWLYKDIGIQGMVYAKPGSAWMRLVGPILDKKRRLGTDGWGTVATDIKAITEPLLDLVRREFPGYDPFPFGPGFYVNRLVGHILLAEPLALEFAERFRGLGEREIEQLAASFRLANCSRREPLIDVLRTACRA